MTTGSIAHRQEHQSVFRRVRDWWDDGNATQQAAILDALPSHVAVLDKHGLIISVNEAWRRFDSAESIHCPHPEVGRNYAGICDAGAAAGSPEALQIAVGIRSVLAGGVKIFGMEYSCGSALEQRWFLLTVTPVGGDRVDGALVMHRDVTARRNIEQNLRASTQRLENLVNTARDGIVTVDNQHRIVLCNPAAESMFGYSVAELSGQPLDLLVPEPFRATHSVDIAKFAERGDSRDKKGVARPVTGLRKNGETFRIEASISRFEVAGERYLTAILRDVTERQQASDQLRESERRLSDMLSNVELVSIMLDQDAKIDYCNDYFLNLTGWRRDEVLGKSFFELFVPRASHDELRRAYSAMLANREGAQHHESSILTRSGKLRLIRWNNSVLRSNQGEVIGVASIGEDVTEQIRSNFRIERLSHVYAVLGRINALIVRVSDRQELFREACRIAVETGPFIMAWIGVIDPQTLQGKVVAWQGGQEDFIKEIKLTARAGTADSELPASRALAQLVPVICNDIATDLTAGALRDDLLARGQNSLACFPLTVAGRARAVLSLYAAERNAFDKEETGLLLELAGNISFALDHIEKRERLSYLAYYDELTGLANRGLFLERVAQYLRGVTEAGGKLAVGLIDLERFKNINHSLGRPSGDELLRQVAKWLTHTLGDATMLARIGTDLFAVVFPNVKSEAELGRLIETMIETFQRHPFWLNAAEFHVGAKIGLALFPDDGADCDTLYKNAEAALRKAKTAGDSYLFYAQRMTETGVERLHLENLLRAAVDQEQFTLHYQPKVSLASGKLTGAEALLRWNDPRTGLVLPGEFIPILEETGLIHEVGRWAMNRAVADYLRWRAAGLPAVRIAVNVSALQLRSRSFIDDVREAVTADAHAATGLELEITESLIMEDVRHSRDSLQVIKALGVTIAIDDFGTGFSSLNYLAKLPMDTLKIDRSFVNDMTTGPQGVVLVSTIIHLAHSLQLKVVAEGVETEEQSRLLRELKCDEMQGYLFGKPVPREIFESLYLGAVAGG